MKTFFGEFKQFIARGNVMDMAVGVIIGGSFNGIITSLIDCIINPILGMFAGDGTALAASLSFRLPGGGDGLCGVLPGEGAEPAPPQKGGGPPSPARALQ